MSKHSILGGRGGGRGEWCGLLPHAGLQEGDQGQNNEHSFVYDFISVEDLDPEPDPDPVDSQLICIRIPKFWIRNPDPDPYFLSKRKKKFEKKVQCFTILMIYSYLFVKNRYLFLLGTKISR